MANYKILIVDDDVSCLTTMQIALEEEGFEVFTANNGQEALNYFKANDIDLIISDIQMPLLDGELLLQEVRKLDSKAIVILVTAHSSLNAAAQSVIKGAYDYLSKPIELDDLLETVTHALEYRKNISKSSIHQVAEVWSSSNTMVGRSRVMLDLFKTIGRAAQSDSTVLVLGESGTGKELIARQIHSLSKRAEQKFVAINCGALTETLLESELFGHIRGSFTGATSDHNGLFKEANGGTIFLDEIAETSLAFQTKLLRVLQEREIMPVGSSISKKVDVRIITACNQDMQALVDKRLFRADLFYRLRVITLALPPLRERQEDIPLLADFFVKKYSLGQPAKILTPEVLDLLQKYLWPGNVRELEHVIESAVVLSRSPVICLSDLPATICSMNNSDITDVSRLNTLEDAPLVPLSEMEYHYSRRVLAISAGNKSRAARILGIDRKTLERIISRYESSKVDI